MSKIRDVYQAIVALSKDGQCDAKQEQLTKLAEVSERHLRRIVRELTHMGLIEVVRVWDNRIGKVHNRYFILWQPDSGSPVGRGATGLLESGWSGATGLPESGWGGQPDSGSPVGRNMYEDMMHEEEINFKKLDFLDFFSEPGRSYRAKNCTLEQAQAWRSVKDFYDTHDLWQPLGISNPIGWIYRMMELGQPPPALQIPLPESSIDLSPFTSRGMTQDEIQAKLSSDGATLGPDGIWR